MRKTIEIQNLKCGGCANTIIKKLSAVEAISHLSISVETSEVSFNYNASKDLELLENKLIQLGYPPVRLKNTISTKAKSYISCAMGKIS